MTREEVTKRTQVIFRDIFDNARIVLYDAMTANDISGWDSLNHINLLAAIQQEFQIQFQLIELQQLNNIGAIIDLIVQKT